MKLLFTTPNNLEILDMLSGQFRYRLRIGRWGRLCNVEVASVPYNIPAATGWVAQRRACIEFAGLEGASRRKGRKEPQEADDRCWLPHKVDHCVAQHVDIPCLLA